MKRGKGLKREGKRGTRKRAFRDKCRAQYGLFHGERVEGGWKAPCQICGEVMYSWEADACHKDTSGMGGAASRDVMENILIAHGHRCGPYSCHGYADAFQYRRDILEKSGVNCVIGGHVKWPEEEKPKIKNLIAQMASWRRRLVPWS